MRFTLIESSGRPCAAAKRAEPWPSSTPRPSPAPVAVGERDDRRGVAEARPAGQQALLRELHGAGDRGAHGDGVHAGPVAGVVGLHDGGEVADAAVAAERPDALVLGPLAALAAGRGAPRAADDAAAAGGALLHVVALEHLAGDLAGQLELALAEVARREGPGLVEHVDQHRRAELGQRLGGDRVGLEDLLGLVHDELEALRIGDCGPMGAVPGDHDGLELLEAHHGAQATAADGTPAIVDDGGEEHAALARRADDRGLALRVQLAQTLQRGRHVEAPHAGGVVPFHAVDADRHVAGFVEGADDHQVVPADAAEGVAPVAARVAVEHGTRERRAAGDAVAAARRGAGARKGARREDQQVLGAERLDFVQPLAQGEIRSQTAAAEERARHVSRQLLVARRVRAQVEAQAAQRTKC